jgi:hypothetical protein
MGFFSVQWIFWVIFFSFLIQVLILLTGAFSMSLPLLQIGVLGYVAINVAPARQLCGDQFSVFEYRLSLVEWAMWCRQIF